ncbi:MAG: DUF3419 family protein [Acidobacteria bacterium]|nr:DUF3419 family protein [Acidobacteriota bacterium]
MRKTRALLRYSCVWEDADVLCSALEPVAKERRLLSISSAGDNALALLTLDPSEVVVIDVDQAQLNALEVALASIRGARPQWFA